jgi:hypothetical protein
MVGLSSSSVIVGATAPQLSAVVGARAMSRMAVFVAPVTMVEC